MIIVTRYLSLTEAVTYEAIVSEVDGPKVRLERTGPYFPLTGPMKVPALIFEPAYDKPVEDYQGWFIISGIPVELSYHTEEARSGTRTMTAVVMEHIQVW
jgi:hypothetical protein